MTDPYSRPCLHCAQPLTDNRLLRSSGVCGACVLSVRPCSRARRFSSRPCRFALSQAPPQVVKPALQVGARVTLLWEPAERGRLLARERDGWVVEVEGWGRVRVWEGEMKLEVGA